MRIAKDFQLVLAFIAWMLLGFVIVISISSIFNMEEYEITALIGIMLMITGGTYCKKLYEHYRAQKNTRSYLCMKAIAITGTVALGGLAALIISLTHVL